MFAKQDDKNILAISHPWKHISKTNLWIGLLELQIAEMQNPKACRYKITASWVKLCNQRFHP